LVTLVNDCKSPKSYFQLTMVPLLIADVSVINMGALVQPTLLIPGLETGSGEMVIVFVVSPVQPSAVKIR
jgi:hypothetical protein